MNITGPGLIVIGIFLVLLVIPGVTELVGAYLGRTVPSVWRNSTRFAFILSGIALIAIGLVITFKFEIPESLVTSAFTPTPTIVVASTANNAATLVATPSSTLLQFGNGFPFTDPSGDGICKGTSNQVIQSDRVNTIGITFNSGQNGFCGWKILLNGYNLSSKKRISFWVKGEKGGEQFRVGLKDTHTESGKEPKVSKEAFADWAQITILLDEFTPHPDLTSLDNLSLSFESGSGKIYVDQLIFAP